MSPTLASLTRFFHLSALALLVGALVFILLIARPASKKTGGEMAPVFRDFDGLILKLAWWSLMGVFFSGLLMLWIQVATITSRPLLDSLSSGTIGAVLTGTQYGKVWLARLVIILLLATTLLIQSRGWQRNYASALRLASGTLGAFLIMALALAGHAAAGEGQALFTQIGADALHLLATGVWLGGLTPLAILLSSLQQAQPARARAVVQEATRRFSLLGLLSVSTLLLTGSFNAWNLVGGFAPLLGTNYGFLLILKLGSLFLLMIFAAVNLFQLKPKLLADSADFDGEKFQELLTRLKRNVLGEALLGGMILLMVGAMGVTPPARHIQPEWPFSFRWSWVVAASSSSLYPQLVVGCSLAVIALFFLFWGLLRPRERSWAVGAAVASLGYGASVALSALVIDAYPTTYHRPSVPYYAISIANGNRLYQDSCLVCHGVAGYGDGPAAKDLKPKPANLTAKHTGQHTAGDLFWWLTHGIRESAMPGFHQALSDEERWDLINFLRTLSNAEQARSMASLVEPGAWLVAPDFVYRTEKTESKNLKEHRGERIILLVLVTFPYSQGRLEQLDRLYEKLLSAGVEVLVVPRDVPWASDHREKTFRSLPVVTDGSQEIFETYALFRRSFTEEGTLPDPPIPRHMEFLIDRQGYVRARWIPGDGKGWASADILLREIDRLNKEKPSAPAPDEHVH